MRAKTTILQTTSTQIVLKNNNKSKHKCLLLEIEKQCAFNILIPVYIQKSEHQSIYNNKKKVNTSQYIIIRKIEERKTEIPILEKTKNQLPSNRFSLLVAQKDSTK